MHSIYIAKNKVNQKYRKNMSKKYNIEMFTWKIWNPSLKYLLSKKFIISIVNNNISKLFTNIYALLKKETWLS